MERLRVGPVELVILLALAIGLGLAVALDPSPLLVAAVAGSALLVAAFLSTPFSLYLLIFSMLLGPEFIAGGLGQAAPGAGTTVSRGVTLRFDDVLLIIIGFIWLVKAALHKEEAPLKWTPLNGPIFLYVAACGIATVIGVLAGRVQPLPGFFFNLKYFEYFFLYFMVINLVASPKQARGLVLASLVVCFLVSLYAVAQIPTGERVAAPFEGETGEPNTLGGYLVFILAIVTGLLLTPGAVPKRWPLLVLLGSGGLALLATLSRASMLAAAVVAVVVLGKVSYRRPLLFTMLLLAVVSMLMWAPDTVKQRVLHTFTQRAEPGQMRVGGVKVDTSTSARLKSWQETGDFLQQSPIWGHGVAGGPFMDAMYPHILVETGLLGMAMFLWLLWAVVRVVRVCYREARDPPTRGLALGLLLGLLGLLIHAIGSNTFIIVRIMEPFWLVVALLVTRFLAIRAEQPEAGDVWAQTAAEGEGLRRAPDQPFAVGPGPAGSAPAAPGLARLRRP